MPDAAELPPRPLPPRRGRAAIAAWLEWFGLGRLVASAVSVVVVIGGAVWLLRAPEPMTEAALPLADGSALSATLPPPSTTVTAVAPPAPTITAGPSTIVVHVAGAVAKPGVFELSSPARVTDAVQAAGGPVADADMDGLNLAAPLFDGQRVYVPRAGEIDPASVPSGGGGTPIPGQTGQGTTMPPGPVDLNTASAAELETLPGIGPATAAAIVDDRMRNGPFSAVDDLERVPGIGPAKVAALRDRVSV